MIRIDSHVHIGRSAPYESTLPELLKQMQSHSIDIALVSNMDGNLTELDASAAASPSGLANGALAHALEQHHNLHGLYWIRPSVEQDLRPIRRFLQQQGTRFVGLKMHPTLSRTAPCDLSMEPYLALCEERGLPLCVHTQKDEYASIRSLAKAAIQHPKVNFIAVHMEMGSDHEDAMEAIRAIPNLYGDTTLLDAPFLPRAMEICGADKLLFGSDAAVLEGDNYTRYVPYASCLTPQQMTALFQDNAMRLFNLRL